MPPGGCVFTGKALDVGLGVRFTVGALCAGSSVPALVTTFHDCMLSFGRQVYIIEIILCFLYYYSMFRQSIFSVKIHLLI